jgi:Arc/MetJ-type ribon-helix-helix transcriptional regulator
MTLTIRLPGELEAKLEACVAPENVDEFVRQAIAEKLAREPEAAEKKPSPFEQGKHLFGKYSSGRSDISEKADEIVAEIIRAKHRR